MCKKGCARRKPKILYWEVKRVEGEKVEAKRKPVAFRLVPPPPRAPWAHPKLHKKRRKAMYSQTDKGKGKNGENKKKLQNLYKKNEG